MVALDDDYRRPDPPWSPQQTDKIKKRFLQGLAQYGTVIHGCEAAGINRSTVYAWRADDPEFDAAWREALEDNTEQLEASIYQRAKSSDTLAIFMAKARRPEVYRDNYKVDVNLTMDADSDAIRDAVGEALGALGAIRSRGDE